MNNLGNALGVKLIFVWVYRRLFWTAEERAALKRREKAFRDSFSTRDRWMNRLIIGGIMAGAMVLGWFSHP